MSTRLRYKQKTRQSDEPTGGLLKECPLFALRGELRNKGERWWRRERRRRRTFSRRAGTYFREILALANVLRVRDVF